MENPNTVSNKHYNNYLKVLYKLGDYEKLLDSCQKMQNLYQNDLSPFDYISKVFVKLYVDDDKMVESFVEKAENASKRLLEENPQLTMGLLTKSILLYRASNVVEAKELLIQGDRLLTRL